MENLSSLQSTLPPSPPSPSPPCSSPLYFSLSSSAPPSSCLTKAKLLAIYAEVIDTARKLLAPFGFPPALLHYCPSPSFLLSYYQPAFDLLLDVASEMAYEKRGLTEAMVAVAVHGFLEEDKDADVREALECMQVSDEEGRGDEEGRRHGGKGAYGGPRRQADDAVLS